MLKFQGGRSIIVQVVRKVPARIGSMVLFLRRITCEVILESHGYDQVGHWRHALLLLGGVWLLESLSINLVLLILYQIFAMRVTGDVITLSRRALLIIHVMMINWICRKHQLLVVLDVVALLVFILRHALGHSNMRNVYLLLVATVRLRRQLLVTTCVRLCIF